MDGLLERIVNCCARHPRLRHLFICITHEEHGPQGHGQRAEGRVVVRHDRHILGLLIRRKTVRFRSSPSLGVSVRGPRLPILRSSPRKSGCGTSMSSWRNCGPRPASPDEAPEPARAARIWPGRPEAAMPMQHQMRLRPARMTLVQGAEGRTCRCSTVCGPRGGEQSTKSGESASSCRSQRTSRRPMRQLPSPPWTRWRGAASPGGLAIGRRRMPHRLPHPQPPRQPRRLTCMPSLTT